MKKKKESQKPASDSKDLADKKEVQLDSTSAQQNKAEIENEDSLASSVPQATSESKDVHDSALADNHESKPKLVNDDTTKIIPIIAPKKSDDGDKLKVRVSNPSLAPLPFDDHDAGKIVAFDVEAQTAQLVRQSSIDTVANTSEKTASAKRNDLIVHDLYNVPHQVQEPVTVDLFEASIESRPVEVIPQDTWMGYSDQETMVLKENPDRLTDLDGNPYALQFDNGLNAILPDPSEVKIPVNIKVDPGFANVHPTLSDNVVASSGEVFNMDGIIAANYNSVGKTVSEEEMDPFNPRQPKEKKDRTLFTKVITGLPQVMGPAAFIQVLNGTSYDYQVKNNYISDKKGNYINLAKNNFKITFQPIGAESIYQSTDSRHLAVATFTDTKLKVNDGKVTDADSLRMLSIDSSTTSVETTGTIYSVQQSEELGGIPKKDRTLVIDTKRKGSDRVWQEELQVDKTLFKNEWDLIEKVDKWNGNFNSVKKQSRFGDGTGLDSLTAQTLRFATNDRLTDNTLLFMNTYASIKSLYNSLLIRPKINKLTKAYYILFNDGILNNVKKVLTTWKNSGNFLVWKDSVEKLVDLCKVHKLHDGELYDKRNPLISKVFGFMSNYDICDKAHQYSTLVIPSPTAMRDSISNVVIDYGMISSNMLNNESLLTYDAIASTAISYNGGDRRRRKGYDFSATVFKARPINYKDLYLASTYNTDKSSEFKPFKPIKSEVKGTIGDAHLETSVTTNDDGQTVDIRLLHESNAMTDFALQYLLQLSALSLFFTKVQNCRVTFNNVVDKYGLPLALSSFPELVLNPSDAIDDLIATIDWILDRYSDDKVQPNGDYKIEDLKNKLNDEAKPFTKDDTAKFLRNLWNTTPYLGRVQKPSAVSELVSNLSSVASGTYALNKTPTILLNSTLSRSHLQLSYDKVAKDKVFNLVNKSKALYHSSAEFIDLIYNTRSDEYTFKPFDYGAIITRRLRMPSFSDIDDNIKLKPNGKVFSTNEDLSFPLSVQYMKYILIKPTSSLLPFFPEFYLKSTQSSSFIPLSVISEGFSSYTSMVESHKLLSALVVRPNPESGVKNILTNTPLLIQPMNFVFYPRNDAFTGDCVMDKYLPYNVYKRNEPSNYVQLKDVIDILTDKDVHYIKYLTPYSMLDQLYGIELTNVYTQTDDSYRVLPYLDNLITRIRQYYKGLVVKFTTDAPQPIQPDVVEEFLIEKHIATYKLSDLRAKEYKKQPSTEGLPISSVESEIAPESLKL